MPAAVFDLDGTLVHSAPDIIANLRLALQEAGLPCPSLIPDSIIGPPVQGMIQGLGIHCTPEQERMAVAAFRRLYDASPMPLTKPYPKAIHLLQTLRTAGWSIHVATIKPTLPTQHLIQRFFPDLVQAVGCSDLQEGRKLSKFEILQHLTAQQHLREADSWMIGDSASDIQAGRTMGWKTIAVRWGYGKEADIQAEGPTCWARDLTEILSLLSLEG